MKLHTLNEVTKSSGYKTLEDELTRELGIAICPSRARLKLTRNEEVVSTLLLPAAVNDGKWVHCPRWCRKVQC